jgi:DNA-directed RNA polymerase specialized sigma24 family protein
MGNAAHTSRADPPTASQVSTLDQCAEIAKQPDHPLQRQAYEFAVSAMNGALISAARKVSAQLGRNDLYDDIHSEAVLVLWGLLRSYKPGAGSKVSSYVIAWLTHQTRTRVVGSLSPVHVPTGQREAGVRVYGVSIDTPDSDDEDVSALVEGMIAPGSSPAEFAEGNQIIERMMQGENSSLFVGVLHGYTQAELAAERGVSAAYVGQLLIQVRKNLAGVIK